MSPIILVVLTAIATPGIALRNPWRRIEAYNPKYHHYWSDRKSIYTTKAPKPACALSAFPPKPSTGCCGYDSTMTDYIVGGEQTRPGQYPWLVAIDHYNRVKRTTEFQCGGSLISGKYVLTAAHCVRIPSRIPISVRLGEYDIDHEGPDCITTLDGTTDCTDGALRIRIKNFICHQHYYKSRMQTINDIALIRLRETAPFTNFIRPICLPEADIYASNKATTLYTAGWGSTHYKTRNVLRHLDMPLRRTQACRRAWGRFVDDGHICAGGVRGKDTCDGDSGGPLMNERFGQYEVVGITSYGSTKCGIGKPAGFTNVFKFKSWLTKHIYP